MSKLLTHGLSSLMEACRYSERADIENDTLLVAFEEAIDPEIVDAMTNAGPKDTVETDMDGEGIGDDEKIVELLKKIPPSDEGISDEVEKLTESLIPSDALGLF